VLPPSGGARGGSAQRGALRSAGPRVVPAGLAGVPSPARTSREGAGPTDLEVSRRSLSIGYRSDNTKRPLRPRVDEGSACSRAPMRSSARAHEARPRLSCSARPDSSLPRRKDLALSDVGCARCFSATRWDCPPHDPATLAFALSRRGLFYPLASLDISGQWPVFEQEPHRNGRSVRMLSTLASKRAEESYTPVCRACNQMRCSHGTFERRELARAP